MLSIFQKVKGVLHGGKYGRLAKNSIYLTFSLFGSKLLGFLLVPLYTSVLQTAEMGMMDVVSTTATLLLYAVSLNIGDSVFIFSMDKQYDSGSILKIGIKVIIRGLTISTIGLFVFSYFNPVHWPLYCYGFLWLTLVLNAFSSVVTSYLRAEDKVKVIAVSGVISTAVAIACNLLFLLVFKFGIVGFFAAGVIGSAIALTYSIISADGFIETARKSPADRALQKAMLKYSLPLVINGISWWINTSLDHYFITAMSGLDLTGIYSVASKTPTILSTVNSIFLQAWSISAVKEFDKDDKDGFFSNTYTGYSSALIFCSSILILMNVPLAKLLYAKDFFFAWRSSSWLILSVLFNSMAGFSGSIFGAVKNSRAYAVSTIGAAGVNILLDFLLIPKYQEVGAAIATAVSFFVLFLSRRLYSRKFIHWKPKTYRDLIAYPVLVIQIILDTLMVLHHILLFYLLYLNHIDSDRSIDSL